LIKKRHKKPKEEKNTKILHLEKSFFLKKQIGPKEDLSHMVPLQGCVLKKQGITKKISESEYLVYPICVFYLKAIGITPFSCKYSKKIYTQHQLTTRAYSLQRLPESIQQVLGLSAIPHFTTFQKFLSRVKSHYLRFIFRKTLNLFYSNEDPIPVMSIGSFWFTRIFQSLLFRQKR
jgi:hypothetical protein